MKISGQITSLKAIYLAKFAFLKVIYAAKGDFLVNGEYLFEVGGLGKSFEQIKDAPNGFLALDNMETGVGNRIPLWMFGLLY